MILKQLLGQVFGNANERELKQMQPAVQQINELEEPYERLTDAELRAKTEEFVRRLKSGETLDDLLVEAFAAAREASKRTIGQRPYDVQLLGGIGMHRGRVVEMKTGEGKTLAATLPLYLNALTNKGCHLVTVNDYLARRDVQWMGQIYHALGLSVGLLQQGQDQSFLYDPNYDRGGDDYRSLRPVQRREAYAAQITYGTNNEFGFDYLRDNSAYSLRAMAQRGFHYAIVDEVDNILIDEARTPLIISGPASEATDEYYLLAQAVHQLTPEDYEIEERTRSITLTDVGYDHVERILGMPLFDPDYPEQMTPQQARLVHHLEQALRAEHIMKKNRDYIVQAQRIVIVDEFTGRTMPGRRWSDGLHQAVEAKERVPIRQENITYATITLQNYFRMYEKLSGMTGTAATEAEEFEKIYNLQVLVVPTHRPVIREDHADVILRTEEAKFRAVVQDIVTKFCLGRPVLVGTTSVEVSEHLSGRLDASMLRRWVIVLLLRHRLNSREVDNATYKEGSALLNQPLSTLSVSQLRKLADSLDVSIDLRKAESIEALARILGVQALDRLEQSMSRGITHSVLNARYHTEEARIVARAGEVGAITIATNMAGRGVDIKLGGELDEDILSHVYRVLKQNGLSPYGRSFEQMAGSLRTLDPDRYYLYQDAIERFLKHVADEVRVKALGGLHVIGTERHEARRIDNQLRGRSGRQGDLGSSTFYLSLEDDLMRRFGGNRVADLAGRLGAEDDMPVSLGIVSRAIANAQSQVEGYNFDIRKHLLEYDDVLNTQREVIYEQRKRVLSKPDLREDVWAMVKAEIGQYIDLAFSSSAGAPDMLRLVHYLERVQPVTSVAESSLFPSFSLNVVLAALPVGGSPEEVRSALGDVLRKVLDIQRRMTLEGIDHWIARAFQMEKESVTRLLEAAATAYEGAEVEAEEAGRDLDVVTAARSVSGQIGFEIDARSLPDAQGRQLEKATMDQVRALAQVQARERTLAQIQARTGVEWDVPESLVSEQDASALSAAVSLVVERALTQQMERMLQEVEGEIHNQIRHPEDCARDSMLRFLHNARFGTRTEFDKRHRRVSQRVERFDFVYWAAERISSWDRERVEGEILAHLENAIHAWEDAWGQLEMHRIGANRFDDLDEETQLGLEQLLGEERFATLANLRVTNLSAEDAQAVQEYLGQRVLFNVQRQLMLDITSRYWVEHLTAIEELRTGIGLQSYAQKDPLAEYKVRAYEMFQELLKAIQAEVVMAMFTYRPRDLAEVRVGIDRKKKGDGPASGAESAEMVRSTASTAKGTRKRRKRRKGSAQ